MKSLTAQVLICIAIVVLISMVAILLLISVNEKPDLAPTQDRIIKKEHIAPGPVPKDLLESLAVDSDKVDYAPGCIDCPK